MSTHSEIDPSSADAGVVTVRYWAAARTAAGLDSDDVAVPGPVTLAWVLEQVKGRHDSQRFRDVVGVCSVLVGERPVGGREPIEVAVRPGDSIELLPPFAGG